MSAMLARRKANEVANLVVVQVVILVVNVPAGRDCIPSVKPNLPMQACAARLQNRAVWIVVMTPFVARVSNAAIYNDLFCHDVILSMRIS
jgi:hypothetical protein